MLPRPAIPFAIDIGYESALGTNPEPEKQGRLRPVELIPDPGLCRSFAGHVNR
jgi:hypothetical protein